MSFNLAVSYYQDDRGIYSYLIQNCITELVMSGDLNGGSIRLKTEAQAIVMV